MRGVVREVDPRLKTVAVFWSKTRCADKSVRMIAASLFSLSKICSTLSGPNIIMRET